jgi:RNA polymerase sigma-70 factor (ECF subfamily)
VVDRSRDSKHSAPLEVAVNMQDKAREVSTHTQIEERVLMEALVTAMNSELTDDQRHVIILRFIEDFSLKETAQIVGKEVNNVKVIQNRGIKKLRKALEHQIGEEQE